MTASAPEGSIRAVPADREDLLAYEIVARIEKPDIEWMARRVEAAFDVHDTVDMILLMRNYDGAEAGAVFDGEAMKAQMKSASHVRRYAVVGAPMWAKAMINGFSPLTPVDAKTFELDEEAKAWAWVDEPG